MIIITESVILREVERKYECYEGNVYETRKVKMSDKTNTRTEIKLFF